MRPSMLTGFHQRSAGKIKLETLNLNEFNLPLMTRLCPGAVDSSRITRPKTACRGQTHRVKSLHRVPFTQLALLGIAQLEGMLGQRGVCKATD